MHGHLSDGCPIQLLNSWARKVIITKSNSTVADPIFWSGRKSHLGYALQIQLNPTLKPPRLEDDLVN